MPTRPFTPRLPSRAGLLALCPLVLCLVLGACRAPVARDVDVRLTTRPDPARVGLARLVLTLPDLPAATVSVEGNMTHAGMAPVRAAASPAGKGRYVVDAFDFNMVGDWVLTVTARTEDGRTLTTDVPLEVVP